MRRALLGMLPALAQTYGIRPWELDRLTPLELAAFRKHLTLPVTE